MSKKRTSARGQQMRREERLAAGDRAIAEDRRTIVERHAASSAGRRHSRRDGDRCSISPRVGRREERNCAGRLRNQQL